MPNILANALRTNVIRQYKCLIFLTNFTNEVQWKATTTYTNINNIGKPKLLDYSSFGSVGYTLIVVIINVLSNIKNIYNIRVESWKPINLCLFVSSKLISTHIVSK